jgi:hypothetical protein
VGHAQRKTGRRTAVRAKIVETRKALDAEGVDQILAPAAAAAAAATENRPEPFVGIFYALVVSATFWVSIVLVYWVAS